jgi:PAS domain-containing protein
MRDHDRPGEERQAGSPAWAPPDEATLRSLIDQVPVTVYIDRLDDISSNVYMSPQLESELGYSTEEWAVDEELLLKVLHPEDRERVLTEHRRSRDTGEPFCMEYRMVARDGPSTGSSTRRRSFPTRRVRRSSITASSSTSPSARRRSRRSGTEKSASARWWPTFPARSSAAPTTRTGRWSS